MMKKILKVVAILILVLVVVGFMAFLYLIPPFTLAPPEAFSGPVVAAPPSLDKIDDPGRRLIAERGKYLVTTIGCSDCHTPGGDEGPKWDMYLAGGIKLVGAGAGTIISRNLTPDEETGIGKRTDEDLKRVLKSGVFHNGRIINGRAMPWPAISSLTDEDIYAIILYIRHLNPVSQQIPDATADDRLEDPDAVEGFFAYDYGVKK